jgi:RNA polymerase sigma factor (sigma-70 family)
MSIPETRASLILRLSDTTDVEAWDEFVEIYQPLVYRLARRKGFQHADAEELVQEVMIAVSRAVDRWVPDENQARFRTWLFRIARNMMINFLTRRKHQSLGTGNSAVSELLNQKCDPQSDESTQFDLEFQREVFQWAANHVKDNVKPGTWEAFWLSSVDGLSIQDVAKQLDMTIGSVYIARSRVIFRLRERAKEFDFISASKRKNRQESERKDQ